MAGCGCCCMAVVLAQLRASVPSGRHCVLATKRLAGRLLANISHPVLDLQWVMRQSGGQRGTVWARLGASEWERRSKPQKAQCARMRTSWDIRGVRKDIATAMERELRRGLASRAGKRPQEGRRQRGEESKGWARSLPAACNWVRSGQIISTAPLVSLPSSTPPVVPEYPSLKRRLLARGSWSVTSSCHRLVRQHEGDHLSSLLD